MPAIQKKRNLSLVSQIINLGDGLFEYPSTGCIVRGVSAMVDQDAVGLVRDYLHAKA